MLNSTLIKTLNSKNISKHPEITKERINDIWKASTKKEKENAVELGGYVDTRSFNKSRTTGFISVRMTIALAIAFNLDPFYIIAVSNDREEVNEEKIKNFLEYTGYDSILEEHVEGPTKQEIIGFISDLMDGLTSKKRAAIDNLSIEELETLLKSYLIRSKVGEQESIRLFLIRLLLTIK